MKKSVLTLLFLCSVFALFSSNEKLAENKETTEYKSVEQATKDGFNTIVFFTNTKACKCTATKCQTAGKMLSDYMTNIPEGFVSVTVDLSTDKDTALKYKVVNVPALLIIDKNGEVKSRLEGWQLNEKNLDEKLAQFNEKKQDSK
jgi:thioredoxin-related protein